MTCTKNRNGHRIAAAGLGLVLVLVTSVSWGADATRTTQQTQTAQSGVSQAATPQQSSRNRGLVAGVESQISGLEKKLKITPAQKPQFDAFADVMRANAQAMEGVFQKRAQQRDRSAPGMLHWYAELTTAHAEDLNRLVPVFDTLYGSLSAQQRKVADKEFQTLRQARPPRATR